MVRVKTKDLTKILAHSFLQGRLRTDEEERIENRKLKEIGRGLDADSAEKWEGPAKMILSKSMGNGGISETGEEAWHYGHYRPASLSEMRFDVHSVRRPPETRSKHSWAMYTISVVALLAAT